MSLQQRIKTPTCRITLALAWTIGCFFGTASVAADDLRLVDAVKARNFEAARAFLKQRVDVNTARADGGTALHWAAHWNQVELVDLLLAAGARVDARNDLGVTPLSVASATQTSTVVERLLLAGADPDLASDSGVTPLMLAARTGNLEVVEALLAHGANVDSKEATRGQTALMWAVAQAHPAVVRALLDRGADVHAKARMTETMVVFEGSEADGVKPARAVGTLIKRGGSTPLLFAAAHGDLESAKLLLDHGANPNDAAPDGSSVLLVATHNGYGELAALLLDRGADPSVEAVGYTPLHVAVLRSSRIAVQALLAHGANPNARLTKGTPARRYGVEWALPSRLVGATPFFVAAAFDDLEMMELLMAGGADPTLRLLDGTSPLMAAAGLGRLNRPPVSSADVVRVDSYGRMDRPDLENRAVKAVGMLLDRGADVNAVNARGDTALHGATANGYGRVIELLAARHATLDVKNNSGQTPLSLTAQRRELPIGGLRLDKVGDLLRKLGATQ